MQQEDAVKIQAREELVLRELEETLDDFDGYRANLTRVEELWLRKNFAAGFEVDQVFFAQSVQLVVELKDLLLRRLNLDLVEVDGLCERNNRGFRAVLSVLISLLGLCSIVIPCLK